jgi:hypothetical protein
VIISATRKASPPIDLLADERFFEILATVTSHLLDPSHIASFSLVHIPPLAVPLVCPTRR